MKKKRIIIIATMVFVLAVTGTSAVIVMSKNKAENNSFVEITSEELAVGSDVVKEKKDEIKKDDSNCTNETIDDEVNKAETINDKADTTESNKKSEKKDPTTESGKKNDTTTQTATANSNCNATTESPKPTTTQVPTTTEGSKPTVETEQVTEGSKPTVLTEQATESSKPAATTAPTTTESPKPSTTQATTTEKEKVWHDPVYEDVWVVDYPAYEAPVYEYHAVCNQCGFDMTANGVKWGTHCNSTLNPDGSYNCFSYTTGVSVLVGTETVPEVGHWEKKLVKEGYWD